VEISLITFGPVRKLPDFQPPDIFRPPTLNAEGDTPMGAAIEMISEPLKKTKAVRVAASIHPPSSKSFE
jgi:uncharacterized protein YegL